MINDESLHARPAASCMQDGCQVTVHMRHDLPHESPLQLQLPPQQCRGHCGQLRSSPRCTRGNEPLLRCPNTANIAESDVIEQLSGKVLSSQFQFNHKMLLPKWKFSASKASIKVLESNRTRLARDIALGLKTPHSTVDLSGTNKRLSAVAGESIIVTCRVVAGWHPSRHGATSVHWN